MKELEGRIDRLLACCGFFGLGQTITAKVADGHVTLEGTVSYETDIHVAGSLVEAVDGVVSVDNWLLYRLSEPERGDATPGTPPSMQEGRRSS